MHTHLECVGEQVEADLTHVEAVEHKRGGDLILAQAALKAKGNPLVHRVGLERLRGALAQGDDVHRLGVYLHLA